MFIETIGSLFLAPSEAPGPYTTILSPSPSMPLRIFVRSRCPCRFILSTPVSRINSTPVFRPTMPRKFDVPPSRANGSAVGCMGDSELTPVPPSLHGEICAWPVNVEDDFIDLLAFTGHKELFGPPGTGGLHVGERAQISPWREGGTGVNSESPIHPTALPFALEGGTSNFLGIVGLKTGVEFILETGVDNIKRHGQRLLTKVLNGIDGLGDRIVVYGPGASEGAKNRLPIVSINIKGFEPLVAGSILDESYGIATRSGLHCAPFAHKCIGSFPKGTIRISPGYFNTEDDVE